MLGYERCHICDKRDKGKNMNTLPHFGMYSFYEDYYHKACYIDVLCYPEKYSHSVVDFCIHVSDHNAEMKRLQKETDKEYEAKRNKLRTMCKEV